MDQKKERWGTNNDKANATHEPLTHKELQQRILSGIVATSFWESELLFNKVYYYLFKSNFKPVYLYLFIISWLTIY